MKELNCGAGLKGRKGQLYEGGIRVPLIVNQPGRVPQRQIDNLVYFPDFMPTLAQLAGHPENVPDDTNGMDISPLFYGKDIDTDSRPLYWEFPGKQRAIRSGEWKAVTVKKDAPLELYRIKEDPYEQHNLAAEYPEVVKKLEGLMQNLRTPSVNYPIEGEKF
jgi:arylsulfatase A-like enzyme